MRHDSGKLARRLGWAVAVVLCTPLQAQRAPLEVETVGEQGRIDRTTQTMDVAFRRDSSDRMTVPVKVLGTGPYRFLVDTGADRTAISRQLAIRLGLQRSEGARLHSVTGQHQVETVDLDNIQLTRKNLRVSDAPLLEREHIGADGILGVDSLRSQRVLFNFKAGTLSIVPSVSRRLAEEKGTIIVQARARSGRLIVTRASADDIPINVVVDTGSEITIGNRALYRRLRNTRLIHGGGGVELQSVTGEKIVGDFMIVDKVSFGDVTLNNMAMIFTDAHIFRQLGLDKKPAMLLGMNAFKAFELVSIDFANKKLRVRLPEGSALPAVRMAAAD